MQAKEPSQESAANQRSQFQDNAPSRALEIPQLGESSSQQSTDVLSLTIIQRPEEIQKETHDS